MTTDTDRRRTVADQQLDGIAQALHAQAVAQVPARTLQQLRARRAGARPASPAPARAFGWALAAACAVVFAVAIGLRLERPGSATPADTPRVAVDDAVSADAGAASAGGDYDDALASLDEDPDLYLWLASSDAQPLAME